MIDILGLSTSLGGLATLNVILVELFRKTVKKHKFLSDRITFEGWKLQLTSWIIAIATAFALWFIGIGMIVGSSWYMVIVYGILTALISNGMADTPTVQKILEFLKLKEKELINSNEEVI